MNQRLDCLRKATHRPPQPFFSNAVTTLTVRTPFTRHLLSSRSTQLSLPVSRVSPTYQIRVCAGSLSRGFQALSCFGAPYHSPEWSARQRLFQGPFSLARVGRFAPSLSGSHHTSGASPALVVCGSSRRTASSWIDWAPRYDAYVPQPEGNTSDSDVEVPSQASAPAVAIGWPLADPAAAVSALSAPTPTASSPPSPPDMSFRSSPGTGAAAAGGPDPFASDLREVAAAVVAAVGGHVSLPTEGRGAPAVDVTCHNFEVMLPVVQRYLRACDFFSFDCEMTGLFLEGQQENYLDDMQDRYSRTAAAAQAFVVNQFGLSCFRRQEGAGPGGENCYLAATFNFYLFPRPPEGGNSLATSLTSRRFMCDAGSLAFLASQGFDFNRCIYDGVPFMPVRQRDDLLRQLDRDWGGAGGNGGGPEVARADVALTKQEDRDFVEGLLTSVREWLQSGASAPLELPPVNRYLRLLSYQALARPESFGGPPGGSPDWHPGFYVKKVQDERNYTILRLIRCASPAAAAELEAADRREKRAAVAAAAGFAAVWEAVRQCGRPAVGHNCMFDVAYCVAQFGEGRLPATWGGFKNAVSYWLPGGLYDTKHICRQLPDLLGSDTSLGLMYRALTQPEQQQAASGAAAPLPPLLPLPPAARVAVTHCRGFEQYVAVAAGQRAHEAGYDAFMTGSLFVGLEAVMAERGRLAENAAPLASAYASVLPYAWRLNVTRSDLPYAVLRPAVSGDASSLDPVPERPLVVYLSALGPGVRANDIHRRCEEAGLGKVRITFQAGNNALLELVSEEAAAAAVDGALAETGLCAEVLTYASFRSRKDSMLAEGTWPLPGFGGARGAERHAGAARPAAAAGAPGGCEPRPAAGAAAAAADEAAPQRPAKRLRSEEMADAVAAHDAQQQQQSRCSIM